MKSINRKGSSATKRVQIDKAQATMLGVVIAASLISVFALVASKTYFSQAGYLSRVAGEKEIAVKQLKLDKEAATTLAATYKDFSTKSPNLIGGSPEGFSDRDGDNGRLVLDALPSKYDFPALVTSLEKLLSGYKLNSISGSDDASQNTDDEKGTTSTAVTSNGAVEIPFTFDVTADFAGIQSMFNTVERSIRPIQILSVEISGTNTNLNASVSAKTFYQPEKDVSITTKVVK